jgi:FlgD Ig-like domain
MDLLPPDAPMPIVRPDEAVTAVSGVGPRGRDVTIGLYAADYSELHGMHVRGGWPREWTLLAVGDSLLPGQISANPGGYSVADRSYVSAFDCVAGGAPVAIARFDVHAIRDGVIEFAPENPLRQVADCRQQIRDLALENVPPRGAKGAEASGVPLETALVRVTPGVSAQGMEYALSLARESKVTATVYDVTGRLVSKISDQKVMLAGTHRLRWDGKSSRGVSVASGVYILEVSADHKRFVENMVIVR